MLNLIKHLVKITILRLIDVFNMYFFDNKTKKISIFNINHNLITNCPKLRLFSNSDECSHYGHFKIIEKLPFYFLNSYCIEHGYHLGNTFYENYTIMNNYTTIVTMSKKRMQFLKSKLPNHSIIFVEPYILKIKPNFEYKNLLQLYGSNNLVVFPSHSHENISKNFETKKFIEKIKNLSKNFENVLICMYWHDIKLDKHKDYLNAGFKIVSAGHRNDSNFINRLKTILLLSKSILTNEFGSYIWYALSLNKSIFYYEQNIDSKIFTVLGDTDQRNFNDKNIYYSIEQEKKYISKILINSNGLITKKIKELYMEYFK
jgi:hypothetical protein